MVLRSNLQMDAEQGYSSCHGGMARGYCVDQVAEILWQQDCFFWNSENYKIM